MILFHGTDIESARNIVVRISLNYGSKSVDFGPGFYATPSEKAAYNWAMRKAEIRNKSAAIVLVEFDDELADNLIVRFNNDLRWGQFVINNRNGYNYIKAISNKEHNLDAKYDITYGRIADYDVTEVAKRLARLNEMLQDAKELINPMYSYQYAFHTLEALKFVRAIDFKEV